MLNFNDSFPRDALEFAHKQLYISEELDSPNMRAESYLNLARAHQRLGGLERSEKIQNPHF